jgi:hypothetical protein
VPQIFPATACRPDGFGIPELREWLERQATTPTGEARAVLARLGILEQAVRRMVDGLRDLHHSAEARHRQVRAAEDAALDEERREIRRKIGEGRLRLGSIRAGLAALGERFVATCLADTEASLGDRPSQVRIASDAALHAYQDDLTDAVRAVTLDLPATVPDFDLTGWRLRAEVAAADSLTSDMGTMLGDLATRVFDGGKAGREAGASLGDWIGKNVFGVDACRETMQRVEHVVRGVLPSLQRETERYLDTVEHLLAQAEEFYASWTRTAPQVMAAEAELQGYDRLLAWSDGFLEAIQDLVREIESSLR